MADASLLGALAAAVIGGGAGLVCARAVRAERQRAHTSATDAEAARVRAEAEADATKTTLEAEIAAREAALSLRQTEDEAQRARVAQLSEATAAIGGREAALGARATDLDARTTALRGGQARINEHAAEERRQREALAKMNTERRAALEARAGERASAIIDAMGEAEREAARASAAHALRLIDAATNDPEQGRRAKRVMGIAVGRFEGHYLTERHQSIVFLGDARDGKPLVPPEALAALGEATHLVLTLSDDATSVRLEGLDGVAREVARRCLARLVRREPQDLAEVTALAKDIAAQLDREVTDLGRRAFAALQIPRAHPDIVKLVGRLNYRTSYTQNQWKHAIEAAFLCGMMADEMNLDLKLARRAALMHDIGKALTHELDGSHAVIGADYARRLGETEVVANAIGAHHTDEPFNSPYAFLVAASDAMSGARPGARRQTEDNYVAKLADLERISRGFRGVEDAFAVQGGREVRIYVQEDRVDDLGAVRLSSEIAETISREMTFPGQIKVTVIRELRAVESAG